MRNTWHKSGFGRSAIAGVLLGLFIATLSLTYFEALHCALHCDADQPSHECAVTLVQKGLLDAAETFVAATPLPAAPCEQIFLTESVLTSTDFLLSPGRAPPRSLA